MSQCSVIRVLWSPSQIFCSVARNKERNWPTHHLAPTSNLHLINSLGVCYFLNPFWRHLFLFLCASGDLCCVGKAWPRGTEGTVWKWPCLTVIRNASLSWSRGHLQEFHSPPLTTILDISPRKCCTGHLVLGTGSSLLHHCKKLVKGVENYQRINWVTLKHMMLKQRDLFCYSVETITTENTEANSPHSFQEHFH